MGLESLKSAFSNIELFSDTLEKTTPNINTTAETPDKTTTEASSGTFHLSNVATMKSQYSIQNEPQEVDYMDNEKSVGFSAGLIQGNDSLFTGVSGESPNMTFSGNTNFYSNTNYDDWPGPMDVFDNDKADGFTLNQEEKSPTRFTGAGEHKTEPYMEWTNNSLYGNQGAVNFQKIDSRWTTPLIDFSFPEGFTENMTESELAKGFIGEGASDFQNTNLYSGIGWDTINPQWNVSFQSSFNPTNDIPPHGTTWNTGEGSLTDYYDSIHTTNAIDDVFGEPVDFMKGGSSYYPTLNPEVPGFTMGFGISKLGDNPATEGEIETNYELGLPSGYAYGIGEVGNSRYIQADGTIIPTGTHTRPLRDGTSGTVTFDTTWTPASSIPSPTADSNTWDIPEGFTYSGNTLIPATYDDSDPPVEVTPAIYGGSYPHLPNPTTDIPFDNTITNGTGYLVDFLSPTGQSIGAHTEVGGLTISGFDKNFNSKLGDGDVGTDFGASKYSGMIDENGTVFAGALESIYAGSTNMSFGTPVDFMSGNNSYYIALNPEVPGFTMGFGISKLGDNPATGTEAEPNIETDFELGIPSGYAFGIGKVGNSRYIQADGTIIPTGTHTRPLRDGVSGTVTFDTTWSSENHWSFTSQIPEGTQGNTTDWTPPDGFTYSGNTLIPSVAESDPENGPFTGPLIVGGIYSQHPNPATGTGISFDNTITNGPGYSVNFMRGNNSYYNVVNELTTGEGDDAVTTTGIPGFTLNFNNKGTGIGNSNYLTTNADGDNIFIPTGTHVEYYNLGGITFTNQSTIGNSFFDNTIEPDNEETVDVDESAIVSKYAVGFTANLTGISDTQFVGIEGGDDTATWTPSTSYYDSVHKRNLQEEFLTFESQKEDGVNFSHDASGDVDGIGFTPSMMTNGYSEDNIYGSSNFLVREGGGDPTIKITDSHTILNYESGIATVTPIQFTVDGLQSIYDTLTVKVLSGVTIDKSPSLQFDALYNVDHTVKDAKYVGSVQGGSNINAKDRFNLKQSTIGLWGADEPYIVRDIGSNNYNIATRIVDDTLRLGKFLISSKGITFIANQNILGTFQQYNGLYDPTTTIGNAITPAEGLSVGGVVIPIPFITGRRQGLLTALLGDDLTNTYSEYLDAREKSTSNKEKTYAEIERDRKPLGFKLMGGLADWANSLLGGEAGSDTKKPKEVAGIKGSSGIGFASNVNQSLDASKTPLGDLGKGDRFTLFPIEPFEGVNIDSSIGLGNEFYPNSAKEGMPFYFRDLRDGSIIFFRAYVNGISDTISPNWNSENYIGRSEPVYTYTNAERELSFNLKLFANTKDELNMIYIKMNRLTSLCYPEYKSEQALKFKEGKIDEAATTEATNALGSSRVMMKPPLTKFRLGELFGSSKAEMVGFIKTLSYTFPDESPWEIENGKRVPKYVTVDIGYQVIHSEVPSLDFARDFDSKNNPTMGNSFYGINQSIAVGEGAE